MQRHANSAFWDNSRGAAEKGLWARQQVIPKGKVLYRFVDIGKLPSAVAADGPWWFEYEHYQTIKHFAERHGYPLGYAARLFAAILYEWSEVNAVVRAQVKVDSLLVWKGRGKQVAAGGSDSRDVAAPHGLVTGSGQSARRMTPMQGSLEVYQLFIPGLGSRHRQFRNFMHLLSTEQIQTG